MTPVRKQFVSQVLIGSYLFHLCVFLDINLLPTVLLKLYSFDGIQGDAASQRGPPTECFGSNGAVDNVEHHIPVTGVHGRAGEKKNIFAVLAGSSVSWSRPDTPRKTYLLTGVLYI